jgi:beta-lactamase regulating signal transducer with metallopeptidase domain
MTLLTVLNVIAETSLAFAAVLLATAGVSARKRVAILRCAFVVLLLAPVGIFLSTSDRGLIALKMPKGTIATVEQRAAQTVAWSGLGPLSAELRSQADYSTTPVLATAAIWAFGALFIWGRYALSLRYLLRKFASGAELPISDKSMSVLKRVLPIKAPLTIRIVDNISTPCTFGWLRPKVLVPVGIFEDGASLEAILAHELCHIRNKDAFWLMVGQLACAIHWFNPLVWVGARAHR